ncbi:unnamed protein product, partial [Meganyctiphanes norvegica]
MVKKRSLLLFVSFIMMTYVTQFLYLKREMSVKSFSSGYITSNRSLSNYKSTIYRSSEYKVFNQNLSSLQQENVQHFEEKSSCRSMFEIQKPAGQNWDK